MDRQIIVEQLAETIAYMIGDFIGWFIRLLLVSLIRSVCFLVPAAWRGIVVLSLLVAFVARLTWALGVNTYRWWKYRYLVPHVDAGEPFINVEYVGSYA